MKAILHYPPSPAFRAMLADAPAGWEIVVVEPSDRAGLFAEIADAEMVLHVLEPLDAATIAAAARLTLIQKIGVGVNTIDLDAARAAGVAVANMPGTNTVAVAEAALALMLGLLRQTRYLDATTRAGEGWAPDLATVDRIGEIAGRTVGLVGFGAVPRHLAGVLAAMGAEVIFANRSAREHPAARQVAFETLIAEADIVSLHLPLTPGTERMIDAATLARMKPGALLINTARGGLVDEAALVAALAAGRLGGAGLDVFAMEPVFRDHPLLTLPNVLLSPHLAWLTPETLRRSLAVAFENMRRIKSGEELLHRVA